MRIDRELLRDILRSLKRGRLHKLLRLLLIISFFYFSFLTAKELLQFYLHEKKISTFQISNFHVDYSNGSLEISFKDLYFKRPSTYLNVRQCYAKLKLLESLRKRKPYFEILRVGEFNLKTKKEKKNVNRKKRESTFNLNFSLPFYAQRLQIEKFSFQSPEAKLTGKDFSYNLQSFKLGGLSGSIKGKLLLVKPFNGKVENEFLITDNLIISFDGYHYTGKLKASKDLKKIYLNGTIKATDWCFRGKGRKENSSFSLEGIACYKKQNFRIKAEGNLERGIYLQSGLVNYKHLQFSAKGLVLPQLNLKGNLKGFFSFESYKVEGISGTFNVKGDIKKPQLFVYVKSNQIKTPQLTIKNALIKVRSNGREKWKISVLSKPLSLHALAAKENISGEILFKKFKTSFFKSLKKIPEATVSGKVEFRKEREKLSYTGKLRIDEFSYEKFSASGFTNFKGDNEKVNFKLALTGKGKLNIDGTMDIKAKTMHILAYGEKIPTASFTLLRKQGISGNFSFSGDISGTFSKPLGNFTFTSENFSYCNSYIGKVRGHLSFNRNQLTIQASSENRDVVLKNLLITFKPFSVVVEGKVLNKPIDYINNILTFYKVKIPVELSGTVSGNYKVSVKKKSVKVKAFVNSANGNFMVGSVGGTFSSLFGVVLYDCGQLTVKFDGKLKSAKISKKSVEGGDFSLNISNKQLKFELKNSHIKGFENTNLNTSFVYNMSNNYISGIFSLTGDIKENNFSISGFTKGTFKGQLENVTITLKGKTNLTTTLFKNPLKLSFKGSYQTGTQTGTFQITSPQLSANVNVKEGKVNSFGTFKNFTVKFPQALIKVGIGTFNVSYPDLNGNVFIPAFEIKPQNFYRLFSVSGIYVTFRNGKPEVSGTKLSYIDGWIEVEKPEVKLNKKLQISGKVEGNLGIKGLIYLSPAKSFFRYVKGKLEITSHYRYDNTLSYSLSFTGKNIKGKTAFLLEKFSVSQLTGEIENGTIKNLNSEITVGSGNLGIKGKNGLFEIFASEVPIGEISFWKSAVSGNLKIDLTQNTVTGKLSISKARIQLNKGKKSKKQSKQFELPFKTNIKVTFVEPAVISTSIAKISVLPQLNVETINGMPVVNGSFFITNGKINYMGKTFKVVYGSGVIKNLAENKGEIDLLASSYISGYYVYMRLKGSFSHPKLILSSDPPLTKEQILNLVMTGASPEEIERSSELFPAVQVAYYATASIFKPFEVKLKRNLGIENFSVEPYITKFGETVVKFTVRKTLSKRFKITGYETTGQNPEYGGSLQFFLNDKYFLETRYNSYYGLEAGVGLDVTIPSLKKK